MSTAISPAPRIHIILDWDGTITTSDTLHLVAGIGYKHHNREDLLNNADPQPSQARTTLRPWNVLVKAYTDAKPDVVVKAPEETRQTLEGEPGIPCSLPSERLTK